MGTIRIFTFATLNELWQSWNPVSKDDHTTVDVFVLDLFSEELQIPVTLSQAEHARSERFVMEADRKTFVKSRSFLRILISKVVGCQVEEIELETNEFGKPQITGPNSSLQFNVSHSRELALVAIAWNVSVGADLERHRKIDETALANKYFSLAESKTIGQLQSENRRKAFFDCWTLKEAFVKCLGKGLQIPLAQFQVDFMNDQQMCKNRLVRCDFETPHIADSFLLKLTIANGYSAAISLCGSQLTDRDWQIQETGS